MSARVRVSVDEPEFRPLDLQGRAMAVALADVGVQPASYATHVVVFAEGEAPHVGNRSAVVAWLLERGAEELALELRDVAPLPRWIATLKITKTLARSMCVVGVLRVAPTAPAQGVAP